MGSHRRLQRRRFRSGVVKSKRYSGFMGNRAIDGESETDMGDG